MIIESHCLNNIIAVTLNKYIDIKIMRISQQDSICAYNSECADKYNSSPCDCKQNSIFFVKNDIQDDNDNHNGWQQWIIIKLKYLLKSTELWTVNLLAH